MSDVDRFTLQSSRKKKGKKIISLKTATHAVIH